MKKRILILLLCYAGILSAQDTTYLSQAPAYLKQISSKVRNYDKQITDKTEKTIERLSRWESKIKKLVEKADPGAAARIFGNGQLTFSALLEKIKKGRALAEDYTAKYDAYGDRLQSSVKYIGAQKQRLDSKQLQDARRVTGDFDSLSKSLASSEYLQEFIRTRKKVLVSEAVKYIGKSRYLNKINKESYYYTDALRNYKEVFHNSEKTEELVIKALQQLPAFQQFASQNSPIAGLFASPPSFPALGGSVPVVNGLTPRAGIQQFLVTTAPSMDASSAARQVQQVQQKAPGLATDLEDAVKREAKVKDFTPNSQRNKSFFKRLDFSTDLQFGKKIDFIPVTATIGANVGYRLNDRSSIGIGISYFLGLGSGWKHIRLSNEGIGLRSYVRWILNRGWDLQGESGWNYMASFKNIPELKNADPWQRSALLGIGKNYKIGKKIRGSVRLFYDFLHGENIPPSQPFIFRFGYGF